MPTRTRIPGGGLARTGAEPVDWPTRREEARLDLRPALASALLLVPALLLAGESNPATPKPLFAYARAADGVLLWCDSGDDFDQLLELACRARRLLAAADSGVMRREDRERERALARAAAWSSLAAGGTVRVGLAARASLERAMIESGMAPIPEHVETDGAMAVCNRCGAMWVPGENAHAGEATWRELRLDLAEFIAKHSPCGVPRWDGRIGLAAERPDFTEETVLGPLGAGAFFARPVRTPKGAGMRRSLLAAPRR